MNSIRNCPLSGTATHGGGGAVRVSGWTDDGTFW
jgi:hypothetical protein